ncbi:pentatricopeptide repeat-containing protein At4g21065-like [Telopea speciosissima]|uniref:pentatricopeptide repeat-containing protein At4g21065-like n=1 Tax=Telopea speciosissima TaxID=54955 RepID=UPI001CC44AFF|nr:pentatricopeptide repeat-containing protein At4g21065-like [Telopea speciosissima]
MQVGKSQNLQKTLHSLLQLSSTINHLKQIHCRLVLLDLHQDQFLITALVTALSQRFQAINYARSIFTQMHNPNTYLSNAMIQAFSETPGSQSDALSFYILQMRDGTDPTRRPNRFTFPPLLKACVAAFSLVKPIQEIHAQVTKFGTYDDVYVGTTLLDSYSKCDDIEFARKVFEEMPVKNVVSWNSMISSLARCGDVSSAKNLFEEMPEKNLVSWTSVISGYAQNGYFRETLAMFEEMGAAGLKPNDITLVSVLSACANLGALGLGKRVHSLLEDNGYLLDLFVGSALIDMYSKCGMVDEAIQVFERMPQRNVVAFSAVIVGLAMNGRGLEAIRIFEHMRFQGLIPNDITFVGVLCACCHAGLVDEGKHYFDCMTQVYSLVPKLQHYACMVDLLGRAGHVDEAYHFIMEMPIKPDVVVWGALLGACRIHCNYELGVHAARQILELDPQHSGGFVYLSNAYARTGDLDGMKMVKKIMGISGMKKLPGISWIEANNVVHQFFAGDKSHPQSDRIYAKLDELAKQLECEGYTPDVDSVFCDVEEEEKEQSLYVHSEKLAIAFGLINSPEGTLIRMVKNLRVCVDCHSAIKLISKIVGREIILRDSNRFHHFTGGMCSCKDYW